MKNLIALTHTFQEWSAVLDFLTARNQAKEIRGIRIEQDGEKKWTLKINETDLKPRLKTRGVALYDLYW